MDFFEKVGALGLGSRLKRLSDIYLSDVRELYEESGIKFEPKWFPVFVLLLERKQITITEAAELLNLTHPHVSLYAKEMNQAKLSCFIDNPDDGRSRLLTLTRNGRTTAQQLQPMWTRIDKAVKEILKETEPDFLLILKKMETALTRASLRQRVSKNNRIPKSKTFTEVNPT